MSLFLKIYDLDLYQSFIAGPFDALGSGCGPGYGRARPVCRLLMQQERWLTARSSPLPFPVFAGNIVAVPTGPKVRHSEELRPRRKRKTYRPTCRRPCCCSVDDMLQRFLNR